MDGGHHEWLGEDGPRFDLLLALDHASGTVTTAPFDHAADPSHAPAPDSVSVRSTVVGYSRERRDSPHLAFAYSQELDTQT